MTRFEQFQQNVQRWATERGIYEHSTALAQALKAVSEVGELCDAVIKNDRDALVDAIGDTAVTIVNVLAMCNAPAGFEKSYISSRGDVQTSAGVVAYQVAKISMNWYISELDDVVPDALEALTDLEIFARDAGLDFDDCCESAWLQIRDRKGRMVAGGAFVKEGE